ncbi:hypothetical protein [Stenotrophomonas maltophilia]|uniref:hypothetical protein n=1 Tax=Stenotrophomonas maltophilia TaxID=40324 RepID=UPI0015DDA972|nr:hypothetical protein [Stenotrophomonas maltophilia]MBA0362406.1 hypothetical protein [Stenotrophomonas maltophilia]
MSADDDWSAVADAAHRDWVDGERNEKLEVMEAEIPRLRAEVEKYRKDAERWQHARKLLSVDDIAERQRTIEEWNYLISEDECKRADEAIDAAMGASA